MKFDVKLPAAIRAADEEARRAEAAGFDGVWTSEATTDPMLLLAAPALATSRVSLGTNILVALARSPFIVAQAAWELQRCSGGRFVLGLGTQVRAHLRYRFGVEWQAPASRLEEYVKALRALWASFQSGEQVAFEGVYYTHTLLSPAFNPGPSAVPHVPVYLAAVNLRNAELAGRLGDGLLVHPMHTAGYIADVLLPAMRRGVAAAGRPPSAVEILVPPFVVPAGRGAGEADKMARALLAFHGATRAYAAVLEHAGYPDLPPRLNEAHKREGPERAARLVPDALLNEFVIRADPAEALEAAAARYGGLATRILAPAVTLAGVALRPPLHP